MTARRSDGRRRGGDGRRRGDPRPGEPRLIGYLYVLPALVVFAVFVIAPMADGAWISLFDWDGVTAGRWVGLAELPRDPARPGRAHGAFEHSLVLMVFYSVLPITVGLVLTAALSHARVRGITAVPHHRLPAPGAGGGRGRRGLEVAVRPAGADQPPARARSAWAASTRPWLGDFTTALPAVGRDRHVGHHRPLPGAVHGRRAADPALLYEAARVDGAGPVREFFAVTLPGLRNELAVALSLTVITALRTFDIIYITTKGGPGRRRRCRRSLIYQRAF